MTTPITSFKGTYRFLSNFYPAALMFFLDGERLEYRTSEHAYQALKAADLSEREWVRAALTPGEAKRRGRQVTYRPYWDSLRIPLMRSILVQKFRQNPDLCKKLLATGDAELIEENYWHDITFGRCTCEKHQGQGENALGKLLMETRKLFQTLEKEGQSCQ